jgi:hypothetical protein
MTTAIQKTPKADGGASRDPASDVDRDLDGDGGDGADHREPSAEQQRADGASKRDPAANDTPKPFNRDSAVAELIDELGDDLGEDAADADEKPTKGKAGDQGGDQADDAEDAKDDQDKVEDGEAEEAKESVADADADESDEPADDEDEKGDAEDETKGDDEADDAEKDPDAPTEAELAKYPKDARKRLKRMAKRLHESEIQAKASRSIATFAERNNMPPQVLQDWLVTGAKVINAREPIDGALILADEVYALIEDSDPGEATGLDRAKALRKLADHLDPEGSKPATPDKLPEALADLVEAGVLTEAAARAAHATTKAPDKPAAGASDAEKRQAREKAARIEAAQRSRRQAEIDQGREAMKAEARIIAKANPQLWPKVKEHVLKELATTWKGSQPDKWATIMRKEAKAFIAEESARRKPVGKKPPSPIRPASGGRASAKKGDDLDAILAED